jgi:translation elongation factor EF-1beta
MSKQEALPGACEYVAWEMPQPWKQPTQKELDAVEAARAAQKARLDALAKAAAPEPAPAPAPPPAAEEDDGGDLWGDDDDDAEADEENEKRLAAIAEAHRQKKIAAGKLKVVINMSKVILDVKPWDDTTDMKELEELVRGIKHPTNPKAIEWQAGQLEDIGYGIKKLRIMVQVIDDEVSVDDDLVEKITEFEDHVQSCDIFAFNKV